MAKPKAGYTFKDGRALRARTRGRTGAHRVPQRMDPRTEGEPEMTEEQKQADWLRDGSLVYRLRDGVNCDEINVTMAGGSREVGPREARAGGIYAALRAAPPAPVSRAEDVERERELFECHWL